MPNFAPAFGFTPMLVKGAGYGKLLLPLAPVKETHLLAAINGNPVIVQLDGAPAFGGVPLEQYDNEMGLSIDGFELEVDLTTAYYPRAEQQSPGDLCVCATKQGAYLVMLASDEKILLYASFIGDANPRIDEFVGYRAWRFVKFNGAGERITLFEKK